MSADFLSAARDALAPARIMIGWWMLLSAAHWLAAGRSPAPWGRWSALSPRWLRVLFLAQGAAALWMMTTASIPVLIAALTLLLGSHGALLLVTGAFWADGSEKMGMIAMAGTLLIAAGVQLSDPALALAGALLAGGQLALCYATAGLSKVPIAGWRDGTELASVMTSRTYGHAGMAKVLRRRPLAVAASWAVIVAEALFPLALFMPHAWLIAALVVLFAFHIGTAVFMGLNKFPWAYAATYPAALLLGSVTRGVL